MTEGTRIRSHGRALCAGLLSAWLSGSWAARFLTQSKTTCPGVVLPTVGSSHISHQEKPAPTDMATHQLIKAILQLRFASSQVTLGYALTIKTRIVSRLHGVRSEGQTMALWMKEKESQILRCHNSSSLLYTQLSQSPEQTLVRPLVSPADGIKVWNEFILRQGVCSLEPGITTGESKPRRCSWRVYVAAGARRRMRD